MNAIDWNTLRENCAGDESLVNEVLALFQGEAGAMLADIGAAVKAQDALAIKRTAHRLKGALVSLAAAPATEAARALELAGAAGALDEAATHYPKLEQEMQRLLQALAMPHAA
jgi:HPt (histidine-containing phosphotransfer) domain-containing protein